MKKLFTTILLFAFTFCFTAQGQELNGKTFILENVANGKALAVNGLNIGKKGNVVHSWPLAKSNSHQHWKFVASGDGSNMYYIVSASPQTKEVKYLEVSSATLGKNGGKVQMWAFNGGSSGATGANQVWIVNQSADGYYNFTSAHETGKGAYALELSGNDTDKNGGKIQIWRNQGYKNQKWKLIAVDKNLSTNQSTPTKLSNNSSTLDYQKNTRDVVTTNPTNNSEWYNLKYIKTDLKLGESLKGKDFIMSMNGKYFLYLNENDVPELGQVANKKRQEESELVQMKAIYTFPIAKASWLNENEIKLFIQKTDGNLQYVNPNKTYWAVTDGRDKNKTILHNVDRLIITDNGRIVLQDKNKKEIWSHK